jgi:hypothetical protein
MTIHHVIYTFQPKRTRTLCQVVPLNQLMVIAHTGTTQLRYNARIGAALVRMQPRSATIRKTVKAVWIDSSLLLTAALVSSQLHKVRSVRRSFYVLLAAQRRVGYDMDRNPRFDLSTDTVEIADQWEEILRTREKPSVSKRSTKFHFPAVSCDNPYIDQQKLHFLLGALDPHVSQGRVNDYFNNLDLVAGSLVSRL